MQQKPLFIQIGNKFFALSHILYVDQHDGRVDIDYGREETLVLRDEEASQFLALLAEHCQVMASPLEKEKGKHE